VGVGVGVGVKDGVGLGKTSFISRVTSDCKLLMLDCNPDINVSK
jgi:hypothetical protein